jgi:hypothetical protein
MYTGRSDAFDIDNEVGIGAVGCVTGASSTHAPNRREADRLAATDNLRITELRETSITGRIAARAMERAMDHVTGGASFGVDGRPGISQ